MVLKRLSKGERREQILEKAADLFAQKGFAGTRTKDIAKAAGISETLIFQHFKTKDDLYLATLLHLFGSHPIMHELGEHAGQPDDDTVFFTLARHLIANCRKDPRIIRLAMYSGLEGLGLMDRAHHDEEGRDISEWNFLENHIAGRIKRGAFRPVNPKLAARFYVGAVMMFLANEAIGLIGSPVDMETDEVARAMADAFLNGLRK